MNTRRDDRPADAFHPAHDASDRPRRDRHPERRPEQGRRGGARDDEAFGDGVKPGRPRRQPPRKDQREVAASDGPGKDRGPRRAPGRDTSGYDRRSLHDRLRDYPRRHDWHDPEDDLDDDELV